MLDWLKATEQHVLWWKFAVCVCSSVHPISANSTITSRHPQKTSFCKYKSADNLRPKNDWFFVTLYVACGGAETVSNVKILVSNRFEGRTRVFQLKLSKVFADRACEICNALRNFSQKTRDLPSNHWKLVFERWKQFPNCQKLHSNVTDIFVLFSNRLFEKDN